ncbi:serpin family protein [Clostridium sediminicola]|uniref:serpin family protein n=1 Tax=Clostridium sediminicola TaxID=3114879 RepID=UPI0031F22A3C
MIKTRKVILFFLVVIIAISTGCSRNNSNVVENDYAIKAKALTESVDGISEANNKVAFKMLKETINTNENKNIVISPISMNTILSLTQNGAAGETKEEMKNALELGRYEDNNINESYKNIIANYNSLESIELKMANSVWVGEDLKVEEDFKNIGREKYEAKIQNVDFSKRGTLKVINSWIEKQTNGKIKKIVDSIDGTAMLLINSVYFKSKWLNQFEKKMTSKKIFTNSQGKAKKVNMMKETQYVQYVKGNSFGSIRLPYEDENFGMYIFLPNEDSNVKEILKEINNENWNMWIEKATEKELQVQLPKFKIEFQQELNEMLKEFGMEKAFSGDANFSNLSKEDDLFIDLVKQKCFIDVSEGGTEAAAVTEVDVDKCDVETEEVKQFIVNRPFVYAIADKNTGMILFMGTVNDL